MIAPPSVRPSIIEIAFQDLFCVLVTAICLQSQIRRSSIAVVSYVVQQLLVESQPMLSQKVPPRQATKADCEAMLIVWNNISFLHPAAGTWVTYQVEGKSLNPAWKEASQVMLLNGCIVFQDKSCLYAFSK